MELVNQLTGGNPEIAKAVKTIYQQEPVIAQQNGLDAAIFEYINRAIAVAKQP